MRLILMLLVLGWSTTFVVAQDAYFQQWVNMEIKVQLDDEKHQLNGWWSMKYEFKPLVVGHLRRQSGC